MKAFFTFACLAILATCVVAQNYCDPKLCKDNVKHIGCNPPKDPSAACYYNNYKFQILKFTDIQKKIMVDDHNAKRNQVAGGLLPRFSSAKSMRVMTWNEELAYLAFLNVRQCQMKHDLCRNTIAFPYSGQNIYIASEYPNSPNVTKHLITASNNWFMENKDANMNIINKYPANPVKVVGHFTAMVRDGNYAMGCAYALYQTYVEAWKLVANTTLITCNYAQTNMQDAPIYLTGKPASACQAGKSAKYSYLCN